MPLRSFWSGAHVNICDLPKTVAGLYAFLGLFRDCRMITTDFFESKTFSFKSLYRAYAPCMDNMYSLDVAKLNVSSKLVAAWLLAPTKPVEAPHSRTLVIESGNREVYRLILLLEQVFLARTEPLDHCIVLRIQDSYRHRWGLEPAAIARLAALRTSVHGLPNSHSSMRRICETGGFLVRRFRYTLSPL